MQWVCSICGYVTEENEKPDVCPVCGAPASKFAEWIEEDPNVLENNNEDDDSDDFEKDLFAGFDD